MNVSPTRTAAQIFFGNSEKGAEDRKANLHLSEVVPKEGVRTVRRLPEVSPTLS
jgi:hypothetical protein